jgi:hypothetical protein
MSQISRAIFGAVAVSLSLGAAQLASGRDLTGVPLVSQTEATINRATKADRVSGPKSAIPTRTVALRLHGLADTSILVRVPVAKEARNAPSIPSVKKSDSRKMTVACEPVVSVLTDVAKLLQPGRCVT